MCMRLQVEQAFRTSSKTGRNDANQKCTGTGVYHRIFRSVLGAKINIKTCPNVDLYKSLARHDIATDFTWPK